MRGFEMDDMLKKFKLVRKNKCALICAIVGTVLVILAIAAIVCKLVKKGCPLCGDRYCDGECDDDCCCDDDDCCCDCDDNDVEVDVEISLNEDGEKEE